jgi:NADH dehydrogenase (ubiquinone) 1 alpha subcomplex subunit 6
MNYWKQTTHVMKYFRKEEDDNAKLPKNFIQGFLEVCAHTPIWSNTCGRCSTYVANSCLSPLGTELKRQPAPPQIRTKCI